MMDGFIRRNWRWILLVLLVWAKASQYAGV